MPPSVKPKIAVFSGPTATIQNSEPLVTSNKARHKYGLPLTGSDWSGLPMRVGHFPAVGRIEDLKSTSDSVLLWTGATSHVDIAYRHGDSRIRQSRFDRRSGMIDILPGR